MDDPPPFEVVHPEYGYLLSRRTAMPGKRYKPEGVVTKLWQVDVLTP
jgi:hypothetical protein